MPKQDELLGQFQQAIDEFFNELLIDRWRCGAGERFQHTQVVDRADSYEIHLIAREVDPARIEVESLGQRVTVRASLGPARKIESIFRFAQAIDAEAATARWSGDTLTIVLPKQKIRRISLRES
jgi:HSP20 family molecular chaperone IbpA